MMHRRTQARRGLTLLEVLVALAIFLFSFVVVCQMIQSGARGGLRSKRSTQAALLCEAKMEAIVAGAQPLQAVSQQPLDGAAAGWVYSVAVEPQAWSNAANNQGGTPGGAGLSLVHVTVAWAGARTTEPVEYTLSRFVLDPNLRVPAPSPTPALGSTGS
jgi:prepilin-type N-terminal cleavage/methylation domain-containing protein